MARKLVFLNGAGETLTLDNAGPFTILKIEGLGNPETFVQKQKAPFQDGTTYIDALLGNRNIVVEIAINAPNDFTNMSTLRRELAKKLNPKLGQGTLTYYDEANVTGEQKVIAAIPVTSPTFPNKDYRDPFVRAQITFLCNDPWWKDNAEKAVDLPTSVTSSATNVNNASSDNPSVIKQADNTYRCAYQRTSDTYLVQRTSSDSITWSAESVINGAASNFPSLIQQSSGLFRCAYRRLSDNYLVQKTSSDGITWSSESVINGAASSSPSIIQQFDGSFRCAYYRTADMFIVQRTSSDGVTWSAESIVNGFQSASPTIMQQSNGAFRCSYQRLSDSYICQRISTDGITWSTEYIINGAASIYPFIIQNASNEYNCIYRRNADSYCVSRFSLDGIIWSGESIVNTVASGSISVINHTNNAILVILRRSSDAYLIRINRGITPALATVTGDYNTPIKVIFNGPSNNPRLINSDTLEYIRFNTTLLTGEGFTVNTEFGNKTVSMVKGGVTINGMAYLDMGSTFFDLTPGDNTVYFEDDAVLSTATAEMRWTERFIGL
jgi:hypothetical protein